MSLKNTIIAFLVMCFLLGALIYFKKSKDEQIDLDEQKKLIFGVKEDDIKQIKFFTSEGEFLIKKLSPGNELTEIDPGWQLTAPVNAKADKTFLSGIVANIEKLASIRDFDSKDEDLKSYSLDKPSLTIEIAYKSSPDKQETKTVYFGDKNPNGDAQYAKHEGSTKIHLVDTSLFYLNNKKMKDFRDKKIFEFEKDSVEKITASFSKDKRNVEISQSENSYALNKPFKADAEKSQITKFINNILNMRAIEFPEEDYSKNPSKWGFKNPLAQIDLTIKDKPKSKSKAVKKDASPDKHVGFLLGKGSDKKIYLKRKDSPVVYEVRSALEKDLLLETKNIVSKKLADFDKNDLIKMVVNYKGKATTLDLKGGKWIIADKNDLADQIVANRILTTFTNYRAKEFVSQKSNKKYGFSNDSLLGLFINSANGIAGKIMFGGKIDGNHIYVTGGKRNFTYKASTTQYDNIIKDLKDIRNRKLYIENRDKISSITFKKKKGGQKVTFTKVKKEEKEVWEVKIEGKGEALYDTTRKPDEIEADVEKIISFVTENKIAGYIDIYDKKKDFNKYGINELKGILEISQVMQDTRKIAFGKTTSDGNQVYAWKEGLDPFYKINKFDLDPILNIFDKKPTDNTNTSKSESKESKDKK